MSSPYLSIADIDAFEPIAVAWGVSKVARSPRGFMAAYRKAGGDPRRLSKWWRDRRDAFVARHAAQLADRARWKHGLPTAQHLALIFWAAAWPGDHDKVAQTARVVRAVWRKLLKKLGAHGAAEILTETLKERLTAS